MSCTDFPSAGLIPNVTTHTVGNITYIWTGIAWESQVNVPAGELAGLLVNDLSQAYIFDTVADFKASTIVFPVGKTIHLKDRGADFTVANGVVGANGFDIIANTAGTQSVELIVNDTVIARKFGVVGDWDGTTGTDQVTALQACIDYFGTNYGTVDIENLRLRADSGRLDFKKVRIIGDGPPDNSVVEASEIYLGTLGGLYTSIQDNQSPHHKGFKLTSATFRTDTAQIMLDLKGVNYPRLSDIVIFGGGIGLRVSGGTVVESHYGAFYNVDISRCFVGIAIENGNLTQSHTFFGGRHWDSVEAYENREGTSDINFVGCQFESTRAARHITDGTTLFVEASTKFYGCRDESSLPPEMPIGYFSQTDCQWSGYARAVSVTYDTGVATRNTKIHTSGILPDGQANPTNLLSNPELLIDISDNTKIPGWVVPNVAFTSIKGNQGDITKSVAVSSFHGYEQFNIDLLKGEYTMGFFIQKDEMDAGFFSGVCQLLDSAGVVIDDSATGGTDFNSSEYTVFTGAHRGAFVTKKITLTNDYIGARFRGAANSATGKTIYFGSAFLFAGHGFAQCSNDGVYYGKEVLSSAIPTTGTWRQGDKAMNTLPTFGGASYMGWVCVSGGTPGLWKGFGLIQA